MLMLLNPMLMGIVFLDVKTSTCLIVKWEYGFHDGVVSTWLGYIVPSYLVKH